MRLIAFVADPLAVKTIVAHLGEPITPPGLARARGPQWQEKGRVVSATPYRGQEAS